MVAHGRRFPPLPTWRAQVRGIPHETEVVFELVEHGANARLGAASFSLAALLRASPEGTRQDLPVHADKAPHIHRWIYLHPPSHPSFHPPIHPPIYPPVHPPTHPSKALGVGSRLIGQLRLLCLGYGTLRACAADAHHSDARVLSSPTRYFDSSAGSSVDPRMDPRLSLTHSSHGSPRRLMGAAPRARTPPPMRSTSASAAAATAGRPAARRAALRRSATPPPRLRAGGLARELGGLSPSSVTFPAASRSPVAFADDGLAASPPP